MNIKRINKVLIYTLLVFSVFTFAVYPKSHSKYIKEEDYALIYHVDITALNQGDNDSLSLINSSTYNKANFEFSFKQNDLFNSSIDTKQIYNITVLEGCTITSINSNGTNSINGNTAKITYSKKGTNDIYVYYSCPVDIIKTTIDEEEYVKSTINVKEKFMPENISYAYTNGSMLMSYEEYLKKYPIPDGVISNDKRTFTLPKVHGDKYNQVLSWLNEYIDKYGSKYQVSIMAYFKTLYTSEEKIILDQNLMGFKVEEDAENYIYTVTDNFIGYARTYENRNVIPNFLYFSTTDDTLAKEAFEYYLNTYTFPGETDTINKILTYVEAKGGIASIMKPDSNGKYNTIPGLYYTENKVEVENGILDYIEIYNTKLIEITIDEYFEMYSVFANTIQFVYDFITDSEYNTMINNIDVINSITKNNTDDYDSVISFNDYFVFGNTLLHIYSDSTANFAEAFKLANGESIKITVLPSETSEVSETLELIDTALGTSYNDEFITYSDALTISGVYGNFTTEVTSENIVITFNISI